jgi:chemotaxis protein histidine kinase CheA
MSSKSLMSVLNSWLSSLEVVVSSERKSELCSMVSKLVVGQCGKVEKCLVLPFSGVLNVSCCVGLRHNGGLYTQCSGSKEKGDLCVSCDRQASKNSSGEPDYGVMSSRLSVGLYDYVDSKGRKPVHYTKFMKKENLTEEAVLEEAERLGISLPREHFIVPADASKRGRPKSEKSSVKVNSGVKGRPKKEKKVVEISGDEDDLFANLVAKSVGSFVEQVVEPAAVDPVSETVSDPVVETVIETVVDPVSDPVVETVSDPVVETVSDPVVETVAENSSVEPVAENSSVGPVAENSSVGHVVTKVTKTAAEKEKQKAEKEAQKAEKEAQKAAEKAEKEKQKAEKEAQKAAEKAEKEAQKAAEKAEKEAQKAAEKAEKEAQKAAEKTNKEKQKAEKVAEKVAEKAEPAEAEVVKKIEVGGVKYLKSKKTGIVYDYGEYVKTGDQIVVGQWNTDTNTIDFKMSNSDEESEEEYEE